MYFAQIVKLRTKLHAEEVCMGLQEDRCSAFKEFTIAQHRPFVWIQLCLVFRLALAG